MKVKGTAKLSKEAISRGLSPSLAGLGALASISTDMINNIAEYVEKNLIVEKFEDEHVQGKLHVIINGREFNLQTYVLKANRAIVLGAIKNSLKDKIFNILQEAGLQSSSSTETELVWEREVDIVFDDMDIEPKEEIKLGKKKK